MNPAPSSAVDASRAALARLRRAYAHNLEAAREIKRAGGNLVGFIGQGAPVELAVAAGALPIQLSAGLEHATPHADLYMPDNQGWEARSLCEQLLVGAYDPLDALVLTRPYGPMYHVLKEVHRMGKAPGLPALFLFDLVQTERSAFAAFNRRCIDDLAGFLGRRLEHEPSDAELGAAIAAANGRRERLRRLQEQRRQGCISGSDALQVIGAGYVLPAAEYDAALSSLSRGLQPDAEWTARPRVIVVPCEPLYHNRVHQCLENAGALVVAEDDFWGTRGAEVDTPEGVSPRAALLHAATRATAAPHPVTFAQREAWLLAQLEAGPVDGVVFYVPPSDRVFGWDYPGLKATLDARGVTSLLLRDDVLSAASRERALGNARVFVEALRSGRRKERA